MPKTYLIAIIIGLVSFVSCKKDPPPPDPDPPCMENGLPCLTTVGANMFACKVNGVPWVANTQFSFGGPVPLTGEYLNSNGWLYLKGTIQGDTIFQTIKLFGEEVNSLGSYTMFVEGGQQEGFLDYMQSDCNDYKHKEHNKGNLNIVHLDTLNYIISGEFQMNLYDYNCTDSIMVITDGRFDFKYAY